MSRFFLLSSFVVLLASGVFADKPRSRLQTFKEDTSEVRDLNRRPSKVKTWVETDEPDAEFEFPWKQALGAIACFAIAAPFALRLYRHLNGEIAATKEEPPVRVRRKIPSSRPSQPG